MTFWKRQNYGDGKKINGCQGLVGRERGIGGAQRIFRAVNLFCVILQWCRFVEIHRMYNIRVNPSVNHGLWVIMMCQCRFTDCNKCTILVGMLMVGRRLCVSGHRSM